MNRSLLATAVAFTAITSTFVVTDRTTADITFPYQQIKIDYKPQHDKDSLIIVDPSTDPPTPLQNFRITLEDARIGTPQNPLGPLPAISTLGIVNPDPTGLGNTAQDAVTYTGPSSLNDIPEESFFVIRTQISDPGAGQPTAMKTGTVKFFNEQKGFGLVVSGQSPGQPEFDYSLIGEINPAQSGLTFSSLPNVQGGGPTGDSFFDIFAQLHFNGAAPIDPNVPLFSLTLTAVPEPSSFVMAALGVLGFGLATLRKKHRRM